MNIYCIYFPNGKRYVGVETVQGSRILYHRAGYGLRLKSVPVVARAVAKHGWENCHWRYLVTNAARDVALKLECFFIRLFNTQNTAIGYNISSGGENPGAGAPRPLGFGEFIASKLRGRKIPDERRARIAKTLKGHPVSPEARAAIGAATRLRHQKRREAGIPWIPRGMTKEQGACPEFRRKVHEGKMRAKLLLNPITT